MSAESSRRQQERRQHERRTNPHPFNSPEWLAVVQEQYVLWPKTDRRVAERRDADRRRGERRSAARHSGSLVRRPRGAFNPLSADHILDDDEKAMILGLFADDDHPELN